MRSERLALLLFVPALLATMIASANSAAAARVYPMHTNIVSTTFWVGEIFNSGPDGSQVISTYDGRWYSHFGGCDGKIVKNKCQTEPRTAANNFFPTSMTPEQNPFYLDLPFDDINDRTAYKERCSVVPWANDPGSIGNCKDQDFSYMKNRWVQLTGPNGRTCYGQVEDAGPGQYHDANYVFGSANAQPVSTQYNRAGMDVSPALNGCLGFKELDGDNDRVSWKFIDAANVPAGAWRIRVTTQPVDE